MCDREEPELREGIPLARPLMGDVPFARPVTVSEPPQLCAAIHPILLPGSSRGAALGDVALLIVFVLLFEVVVGKVLVAFSEPSTGVNGAGEMDQARQYRHLLLPTLAAQAIGSLVIVALILRYRRQRIASVGLGFRRVCLNTLIGLAAAAVAYGVVLMILLPLSVLWPGLFRNMEQNAEQIKSMVPHLPLWGFAVVAIVVGVYEEVLFRGFLLTRMRCVTRSWWVAVVISTVLFVAPHALTQEVTALIAVAVLSITFSVVTIWRRSIVPAIAGHIVWNFCQFAFLSLMANDSWT